MCDSDWKNKLYSSMEIFDNEERVEFYDILVDNYKELLEKKNTFAAHKLKSNSLQLGITPIAVISEKIEKNGNFEKYSQTLNNLMDEIKKENLFNIQ